LKELSPTDSVYDLGKLFISKVPADLELFSDKERLKFFRHLDDYARTVKGLNYPYGTTQRAWASSLKYVEDDNLEESNNPYLTASQKYTNEHPNHKGHQHSMRRTTGNDNARQTKKMVPKVRGDMRNPYKSDVANMSQTDDKILSPREMQEITNTYNIDFSDRRVKTIKGKTNMILTPIKNGRWKLGHK
jgi:hypothetical protein